MQILGTVKDFISLASGGFQPLASGNKFWVQEPHEIAISRGSIVSTNHGPFRSPGLFRKAEGRMDPHVFHNLNNRQLSNRSTVAMYVYSNQAVETNACE